jgi:hypothetical protein
VRKRTWHYVCNPANYEIRCDRCGGVNIEWSEYEHMIWCYDCKVDTHGTKGIFDGPVPHKLMQMLGSPLDRWNMKKQRVEYIYIDGDRLKWSAEKRGLRKEG